MFYFPFADVLWKCVGFHPFILFFVTHTHTRTRTFWHSYLNGELPLIFMGKTLIPNRIQDFLEFWITFTDFYAHLKDY